MLYSEKPKTSKVGLKVKYLGPYSKEMLNHYLRASDIVLFLSLKNLGSCFNTPIRFSEYLMSGMLYWLLICLM